MECALMNELIRQFRAERDLISDLEMSSTQRTRRLQWEHDCNRIHEALTNYGDPTAANYFKDAIQ